MGAFDLSRQLVYLAGTSILFCVATWLTRASRRRLVASLLSVLAFTAASGPIDDIAAHFDLWTYPCWSDPPHPPLVVYLGQSLEFVGCLALIAWRVDRAFGRRGLAVLTVVACVLGFARDMTVSALFPSLLHFGAAPASQLGDMAAWIVVLVFAIGLTRVIAGPSDADPPTPRSR